MTVGALLYIDKFTAQAGIMMLNGEKAMLDEMSRDKAKQEGEACRRFQSRVDVEMVDILVEWTQESARKRK